MLSVYIFIQLLLRSSEIIDQLQFQPSVIRFPPLWVCGVCLEVWVFFFSILFLKMLSLSSPFINRSS